MPLFYTFLSVGILAFLIWWLWRKTATGKTWNRIFWPALSFKLLCGILLGLYYQGYGDTSVYQQQATGFSELASEDPVAYFKLLFFNELPDPALSDFKTYSNSFFFVKLLSLLHFITGEQYYLNSLFLSLFSFAGSWVLVRMLSRIFKGTKQAAVIALLFVPSVVFWNSGVMKEPVLLGALCFFWALVLKTVYFSTPKPAYHYLLLFFMAWLLWKIKLFMALIVFGLTGFWVALHWARKHFIFFHSRKFNWFILPTLLVIILSALVVFLQQFADAFFFRHLVWNYNTLLAESVGKPVIALENLQPELSSVLLHTPEAIFSALFRPFIWEGNSIFYVLAGTENLLLLILFLGALTFLKKSFRFSSPGFFVILIAFIVIMSALTGLTTPNFGTLNRYRTIFLPFLVYLLLLAPFWQRLLNRLTSGKRQ